MISGEWVRRIHRTPSVSSSAASSEESADPDHSDFHVGFANTSCGELRHRRDDTAGLLGAYSPLAAASVDDDVEGRSRLYHTVTLASIFVFTPSPLLQAATGRRCQFPAPATSCRPQSLLLPTLRANLLICLRSILANVTVKHRRTAFPTKIETCFRRWFQDF